MLPWHRATSTRSSGSPPRTICAAFSGLAALNAGPGLSPVNTILSTNNAGIGLDKADSPTVWYKGGCERGVVTMGFLARDSRRQSFVVIALTENPRSSAHQESGAAELEVLAAIWSAFALLH